MPYRTILALDWQMALLNVTSLGTVIAESMNENTNNWTIGFLIVSVAALNWAKAYSVVKKANKNEDNDSDEEK